MYQPLLATSVAVLLTAFLPSQTSAQPAQNRLIPANSSMVLRIASPAKWRKQFGTTQVAKLGNSNSLSPFLGMLSGQIEQGLAMLRDQGVFDADLAKGLLEDWQGDIVIAVQIDFAGMAEKLQFGETPEFSFVVGLTSDGKFDLAAVAREFEQMIEKTKPSGEDLLDLVVGDLTLRRSDNGGDEPDFALPAVVDGNLVMIGGTKLVDQASKLLASGDRMQAETAGMPLFLHLELGGLIKAMMDAESGGGGPIEPAALFEAIGLGSIRDMTLKVGADETDVVGEMSLGLASDKRGILSVFPQTSKAPRMLSMVPAGSESFSASSMNLGQIYKTVADVWTMVEDMVPMSFDQMMEGFAESTKVRLKEDLLDHLGSEMLMVQDVESLKNMDAADMDEDPAAMFRGSVYGLALRDSKAFATSLETALRSRGMHVGRKTEEYGTHQVNRMKIAGLIEIEYVITDEALLIGIGGDEGTARALRSVLDTKANGDAKMAESIKGRLDALEPGWNGVSCTQLGATLEVIMKAAEASGEFGDEMAMVSGVVRGVVQDLNRLGINTMVSTTYCNDKGMRTRFRW